MRIIDLSKVIGGPSHRSIPFEGHPASVDYRLLNTHERDGRTNATLFFNIHEGTHIDPPYHFIEDGATIDEIPIDMFFAPGAIVRLHDTPAGHPIGLDDVRKAGKNLPSALAGYILIIDTAWESRASGEDYYRNGPYLGQDLADWLVGERVRGVGLTNPTDKVEAPHPGDAPIHRTLLSRDVLIIENLTNLHELGQEPFFVAAFPLKIFRGCGGPSRVVAITGLQAVA